MNIGNKIKRRRLMYGLTQEELADRTELSKGFISQVERDLTSPSIATLVTVLECLGTNLKDFFDDSNQEHVIFKDADTCSKEYEELGIWVKWLVPNAQKLCMEPIIVDFQPGGCTDKHGPHEGEEYGYVLMGSITLILAEKRLALKKGESFYFDSSVIHQIENNNKSKSKIIWIAYPPSF